MSGADSNIRERHDGTETVHLPHDYSSTRGFHTLCGLCDAPERVEDTEDPVDCTLCMDVLSHVLDLAAHRGVIRHRPRASSIERARVTP